MRRVYIFLLSLMALPLATFAQDDRDDFGMWLELGAEKSLPKNFSVGLSGELRTEDNSTKVDRVSVGASLDYKVNKYLKFGASYNFLDSYTAEKTKDKTNGENVTESYWTPKHRLNLEATGSFKPCKWLRISARERYQVTWVQDVDSICTTKYRNDVETGHTYKTKEGETSQYLRSRLKFEIDKKHLDWSPYISLEFHNCIDESFHLHKLRTCVGTGYKINKHHSLDVAYVLTNEFDESPNERMHALNVGYNYKF